MVRNELSNEYFEWMYQLVCNDRYYKKLSYRMLLKHLHNIRFTYILKLDSNREKDGVNFRYRFGYENNYPRETIDLYLGNSPCSVLEMMIALAFRAEDQIMDDPKFGNRTGQWFWNMIVSLGLGTMCDEKFDKRYVEKVILRFLNRDYEPNGKGGLFTIDNCKYDLRDVEIWYQFMWHLDDVIEGY